MGTVIRCGSLDPSGKDPYWCERADDPDKCAWQYNHSISGTKPPYWRFNDIHMYMYNEFITNAKSDVVHRLKVLNKISKTPVSPNTAKTMAYLEFYYKIRAKADWDHKPKIEERVIFERADYWFPMQPIEGCPDPRYEFRYDLWSNIHYGFVGRAAGFTPAELHFFANLGETVGSVPLVGPYIKGNTGMNDPADDIMVQMGIDLWKEHGADLKPEHLHKAILDRQDDFAELYYEDNSIDAIIAEGDDRFDYR